MSARLYNRLISFGRLVFLLAAYAAILFLSLTLALLLRFDFRSEERRVGKECRL